VRLPVALLCLPLLLAPSAFAQTPSGPATAPKLTDMPLPKEPAAALELLRKTNGLGEDTKPWHVHATYQTFDDQGKPSGTGTFEMWWASPTKYKQVFAGDSFNQIEYGTNHGVFRKGENQPAPYPQSYLLAELIHPLPSADTVADSQADARQVKDGATTLDCIALSQKIPGVVRAALGLFPTYCVDPKRPMLRLAIENVTTQVLLNRMVLFHDEYLSKQIDVTDLGKPAIKIAVDDIASLASSADSIFAPPDDAVSAVLNRAGVENGVMAGNIIKKIQPTYPEGAKRRHAQGAVTLSAVISKEGRIRQLKVLDSPDPELSLSALMAAQQWTYKPYMLNGQPTEVQTKITVRYTLGG
jgi:TonB family protein